ELALLPPLNTFADRSIVSGTRDCSVNAGQPDPDASCGLRIEGRLNRALKSSTDHSRHARHYEVGYAELPVFHRKPDRADQEEYANCGKQQCNQRNVIFLRDVS